MRVAYVLGTSSGGTARHVRMLAEGLARRGLTTDVYAPAATWSAVSTTAAKVPDGADVTSGADGTDERVGGGGQRSADVTSGADGTSGRVGGGGQRSADGTGGRVGGGGQGNADVTGDGGAVRFAAVEIADRPRPARDLAAIRRLRALLRRSRPDVVHAHGLRAGALAALAVPRSATAGTPLIVTVHNAAPGGGAAGAVYGLLERLVARRAAQVLCVSGDLEARMRARGARSVARALVPAPDSLAEVPPETTARLRAELRTASPPGPDSPGGPGVPPIVLVVARLAPQKGLGTLVEAARAWRDRNPAPLLVFAGDGPLRAELARQAESGQVNARFLGYRDDVPALLAAADVVVLPSVWEGQPLIVHETLRAGRPLVASWAGGIPDLTGEEAALLVPPGDAAALSRAVLSVLDDPALATRLGEAAAKQAQNLPTETGALDAALAAYTRAAGKPRR